MNDVISTYGWPLSPGQRRLAIAHLGGEQQAALECIRRCAVWQDCRAAPSPCPHWPVGIQCRGGAVVFPDPRRELGTEQSRSLPMVHQIVDDVAARQRRRRWTERLRAWWAADPGGVVCAGLVVLASLYLVWHIAAAAGRLLP